MAGIKLTEKDVAEEVKSSAKILITQPEGEEGSEIESVRRARIADIIDALIQAGIFRTVVTVFDTGTDYAAGDYVFYKPGGSDYYNLYRFKEAHTAGAWISLSTHIALVLVTGELSRIFNLTNQIVPEWVANKVYSGGQMVVRDGVVYRRKDSNAQSSSTFKSDDWIEDVPALYFAKWLAGLIYPYQERIVSYAVGDICVNNGTMYMCKVAITGSGTKHPFDSSEWTQTSVAALLQTLRANQIKYTDPNDDGNIVISRGL